MLPVQVVNSRYLHPGDKVTQQISGTMSKVAAALLKRPARGEAGRKSMGAAAVGVGNCM